MGFRSEQQPHCRYCGVGIKKETHTHYFGQSRTQSDDYSSDHIEEPKSKAEAQRLLNGTIVSVRLNSDKSIWKVTTWDGESWVDEHFCNGDHARQFGYAIATHTKLAMQPYHDAVAKHG